MIRALTLAFGLLAAPALAEDVTVFAAASLKTALDRVAADWQAATGDTVVISYAGSSQLAQQIIQGAPADIFISASTDWMEAVADEGLVQDQRDLLGNSLVLIAHDPAPLDLSDLPTRLGDEKLAMALVDSVPAGQYGKAALTSLGLWDSLAPHVAQADNVRAALALVALGEAPFGIVYATDAHAEPAVTTVATFPEDSHPPIIYPAAQITDRGAAFYTALTSDAATAAFEAEGFTVKR